MWYSETSEELFRSLSTSEKGLTDKEAKQRLQQFGPNELSGQMGKHPIRKFFSAFADKMTVILLIAALLSYVTDRMSGKTSIDPFIILAIVLVNAIVSLIQENRAEKALSALKRMSAPFCTVLRDGRKKTILGSEIVPGDVVYLEKGMIVPCDGKLLESFSLMTDESALTGESGSIGKSADAIIDDQTHRSDAACIVWSGTAVVGGRGSFLAVRTGMQSEVGSIAALLDVRDEKTPLQKRLARLSDLLGNLTIVICAALFIISLLKGAEPKEMFLTSVSLAVAAIPEGLPAIVTIVLSLGVQRMAKRRAVVRRLPAVETLGCAGIICSDKTGTLTQNRMTVTEVTGKSSDLLESCVLCNEESSPTEQALFRYAVDEGMTADELRSRFPKVGELPFDSDRKLMVTAHQTKNGFRLILKGAPEIVHSYCGSVSPKMIQSIGRMAGEGKRVIGLAAVEVRNLPKDYLSLRYRFLGACGLSDPPREGVKEAVRTCKEAGIRPVMITGDHADTARAIAAEIGILTEGTECVTEKELAALSDGQLSERIKTCSVFARTTPAFKMRIVEAFQKNGYAVAMTGDGVNDAPALKKADIGCAMGKGGTEVAREAADLILTDDNFSTVVDAVREGRTIYGNIRRGIHFLISCNIGEIITMLIGILLSLPAPLIAIQLLWVNLVTDSLPAISLGLEKPGKEIMKQPPVRRDEPLFRKWRWIEIITEGVLIGCISVIAFCLGMSSGDLGSARTMAFTVLAVSQLFHAFNLRSENSILRLSPFSNPFLLLSFVIGIGLQILLVVVPSLRTLFQTSMLTTVQWAETAALCFSPIPFCECLKKIRGKQ